MMSKRTLTGGAIALCLLFLVGCKTIVPGDHFDAGSGISKAQKIVIADAAGNEKAVLTEEADIDAFVEAVTVEAWRLAEKPEGLTPAGSFTLWQRETLTALIGGGEVKENEICTLRVYEDGDSLTIEAGLVDVSFAIPRSAADYLRGLVS